MAAEWMPRSPAIGIADMQAAHWPEVRSIHEAGLQTGHGSFASAPAADWLAWEHDHLPGFSLVAIRDEAVSGWAALGTVSGRCVYAGVAEVSIYVATAARGQGVGRRLLTALVERAEARGLWTLQAGIFPENVASVRLHEQCGFRHVGIRRRLGRMGYGPFAGRWRDVLLLERRSECVGID